ncbi:ferredoxin [Arcobacter sp. F155]|uniref:ferredoxin-type protein NapF n=1 Tax=Arcobacteraceae TaxID=2808963 RepID=UPI00100C0174|nr:MULTISPECIES: ferredoxin-type protein NapF [unclassified Arcobacter]RXJ77672.1 ferredoxin [Arcobacter sp. F155]RXK01662.1 ferredoxin [Arcobacter sp. CECT 8989]
MRRRELFSSLASSFNKKEEQEQVIRLPYNEDKSLFLKECPSCDAPCVTLCEEDIIVMGEDKTPHIDFSKGGCTYCGECAKACEYGVLLEDSKEKIPVKVEIDMIKCLSWHNTMCFSCKDPCLDDAIEFLGMFRPSIVEDKCTSCGFCLNVCPSDAIILKGV